ncbi:MAG: tryptophan--tRNA ligase, partial [Elusimicrobiota bacterium]
TNVNAGLFAYPVLQAADIALYKAEVVPVGEDQIQHLELCREITRKFNARFNCVIFPDAQALVSKGARILGLDGKFKMSKSLGNTINVVESAESIEKKLKTAVTDEDRKRRTDPGNPEICNMFRIHSHFSPAAEIEKINRGCRTAAIGCIECKKMLSDNMNRDLDSIRKKYSEVKKSPGKIIDILNSGASEASKIAKNTIREARECMGIYGGK